MLCDLLNFALYGAEAEHAELRWMSKQLVFYLSNYSEFRIQLS